MARGRPARRLTDLLDHMSTRSIGAGAVSVQSSSIAEQFDRRREIERRDPPHVLVAQAQRGPAGGQHPQRRACVEQPGDQRRDRTNQVFTVVEHHDELRGGQLLDESILR